MGVPRTSRTYSNARCFQRIGLLLGRCRKASNYQQHRLPFRTQRDHAAQLAAGKHASYHTSHFRQSQREERRIHRLRFCTRSTFFSLRTRFSFRVRGNLSYRERAMRQTNVSLGGNVPLQLFYNDLCMHDNGRD